VATPDRPSLVNLERYLGMLERLGMAPGRISVLLNKVEDRTDVAGRYVTIPYSRDVSRSINVGVPLLVGKPKSEISVILADALSAVLAEPPKAKDRVELDEPAEAFDEIDLTVPDPVVDRVSALVVEIAEATSYRGRAPPRPISPRLHTSLVPCLITK
jgi:hypothetical protein